MSADTQKFLFAVVVVIGGILLCVIPNDYSEQGPWLIGLAVGVVFGIAKKPGAAVKLLLLSVILCGGCVGPHLDNSFISLTKKVFDRHDIYVTEDVSLTPLEIEAYTEETAACREYLNAVEESQNKSPHP